MQALIKTPEKEQGRPPVVHRDRERAKLMIDAISNGHTTTMAAQAGGISRRTLYEWVYKANHVRDAREKDPSASLTPYDDDYIWFLRQLEAAELSRKKELLDRIEVASKDPRRWPAAAWLLERIHKGEFSVKQQVEVTEQGEKEIFTMTITGPMTDNKETQEADYEIVD